MQDGQWNVGLGITGLAWKMGNGMGFRNQQWNGG